MERTKIDLKDFIGLVKEAIEDDDREYLNHLYNDFLVTDHGAYPRLNLPPYGDNRC